MNKAQCILTKCWPSLRQISITCQYFFTWRNIDCCRRDQVHLLKTRMFFRVYSEDRLFDMWFMLLTDWGLTCNIVIIRWLLFSVGDRLVFFTDYRKILFIFNSCKSTWTHIFFPWLSLHRQVQWLFSFHIRCVKPLFFCNLVGGTKFIFEIRVKINFERAICAILPVFSNLMCWRPHHLFNFLSELFLL